MIRITSLTNSPKQRMQIPLDGGDTINFYLYYAPSQYSWYFDLNYNNYTSNGNKVVLSYNILRNLKNIIPFGMAFLSDGYVEPFDVEDFGSGRVKMYILDESDVQEIEANIYNVEQ